MAAAQTGFWDWDVRTDEYVVSPRLLEMAELPPDTTFVDRKDFLQRTRLYPEDREKWQEAVKRLFESGGSRVAMDVRSMRSGGRFVWQHLEGMCFRDAAGKVVRWTGSVTDISERKYAEEALRQSEQRYARVMQASADGFWEWVVATDELYVSPRMLAIYSLPPDTVLHSRNEFLSRFPFLPEDLTSWREAVDAHLAGETPRVDLEIRATVRAEMRWLHLTAICQRDASGAEERWTGSVSDVTDRRRAQEALRVSEERYALAMRASGDGHWDWKIPTDEFYASPRYLELAGFPPDMRYSRRSDIVPLLPFHPDDRASYEAAVAAHFAGETPRVDMVIRLLPRGRLIWLHVIGTCSRDPGGRPVRWSGSVTDITVHKLAEEALRLSEERYALAMEAAQDAHWDWIVGTDQYYTSPRVVDVFGFAPGTTFRSRQDYLAETPVVKEDLDAWLRAAQELFDGTGSRLNMELRAIINGEVRWIEHHGVVFRDASGRAVRWCGSLRDTTERRRAEEALRLSEERYALAMEASQEGHFDWNVETDQIFASERLQKVLRLPPGFEYRTRHDMVSHMPFSPQEADRVAQMARKVLGGTALEHEFEYRLQASESGTACFIQARWKIFRDARGVALRVNGVVSDITERKRVEEALRQSEERYALAVEGSNEGIFDWDLESDRVYVSYRAQELFRLPRGELWRRRRDWRHVLTFHPDDAPGLHDSIKAHIQGASPTYDVEFRIIEPGGGVRWYRQRGIALRDASGMAYRVVGSIGDITERKRAEEKLRESEALKSAMFESALDSIISIDQDGRVIEFNPAAERTFGYGRAEAIGKELAELIVSPRLREQHRRDLARYLATGEGRVLGKRVEMSAVRADGTEFPVELTVTPIPAEGAPLFTAFLRDITERKRAEEALRLSEERYALAVAGSDDGVWDVDFVGRRVFASARARELAGLPPGPEMVPMDEYFATLPVHPDDVQRRSEALEAHLSGKAPAYELELRLRQQDGSYRWRRIHGLSIRNATGQPTRMAGSISDIDVRYRTVEALRLSEERYSLALEASSEGHFDIDAVTDDMFLSDRMWEMYGFPPDKRILKRAEFMKQYPFYGNDRETYNAVIGPVLAKGGPNSYEFELRLLLPSGKLRWLLTRAKVLRDSEGNTLRRVGIVRDITDAKESEESLQKMELQLRRAQRLEAMGTLAGGIAHDFNNILGAILGYGEMAQRSARRGSRLARDLDCIMVAGERGRALVDRVLAFSRSAVGECVPVHVEEVVREALDQISATLPHGVKLSANLRAGRAALLGDATQVHQVLTNLVTNSIQALPDGGSLRVLLDVTRIDVARATTIGILAAGEYLVLTVSDSGTGISPEIFDRIFDPFFTTKEVGTGTGLGLSLVHGIVTELGGAIDVATRLKKGTTFTVYLPRNGDAPSKLPNDEGPLPRGNRQRVLVVDDEEALVRLATETLESLGYAPVGFTSSVNALQEFRANPARFDVVLTDERMPWMTGSAVIREVRRISPSIPILLMTGFVDGNATKAVELGVNGLLRKPLLARDLATSLARVLVHDIDPRENCV